MTPDLLRDAVGCTPGLAWQYAGPLTDACDRFDISTPQRLSMFLPNLGHESLSLSAMRESMDYAAERLVSVFGSHRISAAEADQYGRKPGRPADQVAIANLVYGREWGKKNLGNTQPGDGWKFRAAGPLGTTGRDNFRELQPALLMAGFEDVPDFEADPDALTIPKWGAAAAAYFWSSRKLNEYADQGDFLACCRGINLGSPKSAATPNGMADRLQRYEQAKRALAQLSVNIPAPIVGAVESDSTPVPAPTAPEPTWRMPAGEGDAPESASRPPEPAVESPELAPQPAAEGKPMSFGDVIKNPATAGLLSLVNPLLGLVPQVAQIFMNKEGTTVPERNVAVAVAVADAAQKALKEAGRPAENMQQVVETIGSDPEARDIAKQGVMADCLHLVESGGGGIDGARKADTAFLAPDAKGFWHSPAFWISVLLMAYPTMLLVDVFYVHPEAYKGDIRTQIVTGVLGVIMMVGGYWIGTSFSSSKKDERVSR